MSLQELQGLMTSINQQLEASEDVQKLLRVQKYLQDANQVRQRQQEQLQEKCRDLSVRVEMAKESVERVRGQVQRDQHLQRMSDLERQVRQVRREQHALDQQIASLQQQLRHTLEDVRQLTAQAEQPEVDELGLRLKIYKSLGLDWQDDERLGALTKCRVRSAKRNDVQTFLLDQQDSKQTRFFVANHLWNLCDA